MVNAELRIPLHWAKRSHIGDNGDDQVMGSIRLLEGLEKAGAVRLPHSVNAEHLFCVLLQHGLGMRTCACTNVSKSVTTDTQWQTAELHLLYLLKISPDTANSVEEVVKKLASLLIANITTADLASNDIGGTINESDRKPRLVR